MCIAREEGVAALWKGVIPGLHRQFLYGGLRISLYVKAFFVGGAVVGDVSLLSKILAALTTGVIAIVVANPTDLVKVRLQADGKANTVKRSYSGALNAYATIIRQVTLTIMGSKFTRLSFFVVLKSFMLPGRYWSFVDWPWSKCRTQCHN
ncbi:Mitochondrial uncoupling protein 2 [Zea mays]|uniref:Mitochondrial uncoupling protein 2 n=2 Tax=Zea mays TaxID=4577 RepID=A0A1D6EGA1_MAIZE|nr:Mitochondrial uncoupling protein 2 [Zea mays]